MLPDFPGMGSVVASKSLWILQQIYKNIVLVLFLVVVAELQRRLLEAVKERQFLKDKRRIPAPSTETRHLPGSSFP
jgi:hypothetical protein